MTSCGQASRRALRMIVALAACLAVLALPQPANAAGLLDGLAVTHDAISPDGNGLADATDISFNLTQRAWVRATVRRADGTVVRLLWGGPAAVGAMSVGWDGSSDTGARLVDGRYVVRVEAWPLPATDAAPRASQPAGDAATAVEHDLAVDTAPPVFTPTTTPRHRAGARVLDLGVRLDEQAMVDVRVFDGATRRADPLLLALESGRQRITVRSSDRLFRTRRAGTYRIQLVASDTAWNVTKRWLTVRVTADPVTPPAGNWGAGGSGAALPTWLRPVMLRATSAAGVPGAWASSPALAQLLLHESSFNPTAQNPTSTAYGLFQFLDSTWQGSGGQKTADPYLQSVYGLRYVERRYGSPERAWAFWQRQSPHWYVRPPAAERDPYGFAADVVARTARDRRVTSLEVSHAAISPNADGRADAAEIAPTLAQPAGASLRVVDSRGGAVRTIWEGDLPAGVTTFAWDGTRDDGARVADGTYSVELRADAPGVATSTGAEIQRAAIRVDTQAPRRIVAGGAARARGKALVRIPLTLDEEASVTVRVRDGRGLRALTFLQPAGRSSVELRAPAAGQRTRQRLRGSVTVEASDAAWNEATVTVPVDVAPAPVAPTWNGGTMTWPVRGIITSSFGPRGGRMHEGLDIAVATGTPIYAPAAGRVIVAGWVSGYGNVVYLDHGRGVTTRYGHQSRLAVHVGQALRRGQLLGYAGSTGHSSGPHLHFEVRTDGIARNPISYLT
ncbi:MAG: peptidoglycan DD-metalloendopeptidase family protein [Thermoleophilia bacterium]|nr:peptidoglycan DD-metalloendopeptidase family protein [Thermoleophilia bacterium]